MKPALVILFGLGLALRALPALLPSGFLEKVFIDDGAYYLQIARNFAEGNGSTFDGIHMTNGYHPLWMLLLTPIAHFVDPGFLALRLTTLLSASLAGAAFLVLYRALRPRLGALPVLGGLAIWWLAPGAISSSWSGTESSLAALASAWVVAAAMRWTDRRRVADAIWLGVACGVLVLSRSDAALAVAAVFAWMLLQRVTRRELVRQVLPAGLVSLALAAPWFVWNLWRFGTIVQDSTWARPMALWDITSRSMNGSTGSSLAGHGIDAGLEFLSNGWPQHLIGSRTLLIVGLVPALVVWARTRPWPKPVAAVASLALLALLAGTLLAAFHAGARLFPREYYFDWVRIALGMLGGAALAGLRVDSRRVTARRAAVAFGVVFAVVWQVGATARLIANPGTAWQPNMRAAGEWLAANTDEDERVLSFNAGFINYFSQRPVINIDGVVNHAAVDALEQRDLAAFMCDSGAKWYVDFDPTSREQYADRMGDAVSRLQFTEAARFREPGTTPWSGSDLVLFRFDCEPET